MDTTMLESVDARARALRALVALSARFSALVQNRGGDGCIRMGELQPIARELGDLLGQYAPTGIGGLAPQEEVVQGP